MSLLRSRSLVLAATAACSAAALLAAGAAASGAPHASPAPCRPHVVAGVLPTWARTGFSDPRPQMPYVLSRNGRIAGILWANPLSSPPAGDHSNKILWISHYPDRPTSDLRISAQRMRGSRAVGAPVGRTVTGGPGPSIIDLPRPGCWRLGLRWSGRVDTLDLRYVARP
jgi:hypothetical protein